MNNHGFIDFTEAHVQRVRTVTYRFEVAADTLDELGTAAQAEGFAFYGNYEFTISSMDVIRTSEDSPKYVASVWTDIQ